MIGIIKAFVNNKNFGFIKGEDGKDYFFHLSDFENGVKSSSLIDGLEVSFDETANKKGYCAKKCKLINLSEISGYIVPGSFLECKFKGGKVDKVKGWDCVRRSDYVIMSMDRDPDIAKDILIERCKVVGANGMILLKRDSIRCSEAGLGSGTHYYTGHSFTAVPVFLAKKSANGSLTDEKIPDVSNLCKVLYDKMESEVSVRAAIRYSWYATIFLVLFFGYEKVNIYALIPAVIMFFLTPKSKDCWIIK